MARLRLTSDVVLIVASFVIAIAVWLAARQTDFEKQVVAVEVVVKNAPENCIIEIEPSHINVAFQYPKMYAPYVNPDFFVVEIEGIGESMAGLDAPITRTINFNLNSIKARQTVPEGIHATDLKQNFVNLDIQMITAPATVHLGEIAGTPAEGYYMIPEHCRVEPPEILLTGSPEQLKAAPRLESPSWEERHGTEADPKRHMILLRTESLRIEGRSESDFLDAVSVPLPEGLRVVMREGGSFRVLDSLKVQVHLVIGERRIIRTYSDIPITIQTLSKKMEAAYQPDRGSVTVEAPTSVMNQLTSGSFLFIPRQPVQETVGYKAEIALDARFAEGVPTSLRDKAGITSFEPQVISIEILGLEEEIPAISGPLPLLLPTPTPIPGGGKKP